MAWTLKFWKSSATPLETPVTWNYGTGVPPTDVPSSQATTITNYINSIAAVSTLAANRLNAYGQDIRVGYSAGEVGYAARGGIDDYVLIDINAATTLYFFNTLGQLVAGDVRLTLMHELAHIYLNANDPVKNPNEAVMNGPDFDFRGPVITEQNEIAENSGLTYQIQTSYHATVLSTEAQFSLFTTNLSYSESKGVDTTRLGTPAANNIDHSGNTIRINDLLFGLGGDDQLRGGRGNDFLYGGEGADVLDGGEDGPTDSNSDNDTASYLDSPVGVRVINAVGVQGNATQTGGVTYATGDTFIDIETLRGSEHADMLDMGIGAFTIEGGAGNDIIIGHAGNTLRGGPGADTFRFSSAEFLLTAPPDGDESYYNVTEIYDEFEYETTLVLTYAIPRITILDLEPDDMIFVDGKRIVGSTVNYDADGRYVSGTFSWMTPITQPSTNNEHAAPYYSEEILYNALGQAAKRTILTFSEIYNLYPANGSGAGLGYLEFSKSHLVSTMEYGQWTGGDARELKADDLVLPSKAGRYDGYSTTNQLTIEAGLSIKIVGLAQGGGEIVVTYDRAQAGAAQIDLVADAQGAPAGGSPDGPGSELENAVVGSQASTDAFYFEPDATAGPRSVRPGAFYASTSPLLESVIETAEDMRLLVGIGPQLYQFMEPGVIFL